MLFNSWLFLFYAPIVYLLYYLLSHRAQNRVLLVASYIFYAAWDPRFLLLLLGSTTLDYFIGLNLHKSTDQRKRKWMLFASVLVNLTALGFFKYFNFFMENMEALLQALGMPFGLIRLDLVLPVGISFYTFQTISYSVDVYQRKIEPERNFLDYALFVSFFPQLVAGPIERAANLIPQLKKQRVITREMITSGLWLILLGYFKKVVVADNLTAIIDPVFQAKETPGGMSCLFAAYAFSVVAYCDFAGYSDIARGLAKLMGIDIVLNFNLPLIARNPMDFWRRWHISLSFWFRDYLYIPMGGSRVGKLRTYFNLFVVFLLSGLWHGATWTWITWGAYNSVLTIAYRLLKVELGFPTLQGRFADICIRIFYFHLTTLGMLAIRAQNPIMVWDFVVAIFTDMYIDFNAAPVIFAVVFFCGLLGAIEAWIQNSDNPETRPGWNRGLGILVVTIMILCLVLIPPPAGQPFIYFQF